MDFVFGSFEDTHNNNGIIVFVDHFSKMMHLNAVYESITAHGCARVFINTMFRLHGLHRELAPDRGPRFTAEFCQSVFRTLVTPLKMLKSDHIEANGKKDCANSVLE